ncbi:MAG: hypothetical protein AAFN74_07825 [Myxococcota bacterium]
MKYAMKPPTTIALAALVIFMSGCLASIRPRELSPSTSSEARGRMLLEEALQAHGGAHWDEVESITLDMNDHWKGVLGWYGCPWPHRNIDLDLALRAGTFDAIARIKNGDEPGLALGMQAWKTYRRAPGAQAAEFDEDTDIKFILAALQYFAEFPVRILKAPLIAYAGPKTVGDKTYEVVYATWGQFEAHSDNDQYMVYIDPDSHRIEKIDFTLREANRFISSVMHFEEFQTVGGLAFPFKQSITFDVDDDPDDYLHRVTVKSVSLNSERIESFIVDAKLGASGDFKPTE